MLVFDHSIRKSLTKMKEVFCTQTAPFKAHHIFNTGTRHKN